MSRANRRQFLAGAGGLLVGSVVLGPLAARAAEPHPPGARGDGVAMAAATENRCGTCQFWGGMRRLSDGGKTVVVQSMGWCNNPASPNHGKLTPADHEMKLPGIWKKWGALP